MTLTIFIKLKSFLSGPRRARTFDPPDFGRDALTVYQLFHCLSTFPRFYLTLSFSCLCNSIKCFYINNFPIICPRSKAFMRS